MTELPRDEDGRRTIVAAHPVRVALSQTKTPSSKRERRHEYTCILLIVIRRRATGVNRRQIAPNTEVHARSKHMYLTVKHH